MKLDHVITFTDGASRGNPGQAGTGVLLYDEKGTKLVEDARYLGVATNNVAEYQALLRALALAAKFTSHRVTCYLDSEVVVRQMTGVYAIKSEPLQKLADKVKKKAAGFKLISFHHVPREHPNLQMADKLANKGVDQAKNKKGVSYGG